TSSKTSWRGWTDAGYLDAFRRRRAGDAAPAREDLASPHRGLPDRAVADEERLPARPGLQVPVPRRADTAMERSDRLRGLGRRTPPSALLPLVLLGRGEGGRAEYRRHVDALARERRHPRADGALGIPSRGRRLLPWGRLRMAEICRRPRPGGRGAGL